MLTGQGALIHFIAETELDLRHQHLDEKARRGATVERELRLLMRERRARSCRPTPVRWMGARLIRLGESLSN